MAETSEQEYEQKIADAKATIFSEGDEGTLYRIVVRGPKGLLRSGVGRTRLDALKAAFVQVKGM